MYVCFFPLCCSFLTCCVCRVQLGECLKTIIHADYPEQWPRLLDWVKHNLQDQQVYGALFVLRILSRKYEYASIYFVLIEENCAAAFAHVLWLVIIPH
jgi:hypothetical protein